MSRRPVRPQIGNRGSCQAGGPLNLPTVAFDNEVFVADFKFLWLINWREMLHSILSGVATYRAQDTCKTVETAAVSTYGGDGEDVLEH